MTRLLLTAAFVAGFSGLAASPSFAQEQPVADIFGGYSLLPSNFNDDFPRRTSHGLQGAVTVHLNRWFGVAADAGVQWNETSDLGPNFAGQRARTRVHELLVGPRFTFRSQVADAFVHGWFGTATGHVDEPFSGFGDTGMTFGGGGGVDVRLTPAMAARVQFDLLGSFADVVEGNTRFAAGLVYRIGGR